jgi:hypothetical protein
VHKLVFRSVLLEWFKHRFVILVMGIFLGSRFAESQCWPSRTGRLNGPHKCGFFNVSLEYGYELPTPFYLQQ